MSSWPLLVKICVNQLEENTINASMMENYKNKINDPTDTGTSPLHFVMLGNNLELAKWLIKNGAVIQKNLDGQTPLHWACKEGNIEMVKLLLNIMTKKEIKKKDCDNTTACNWAEEYEHQEVVHLIKLYIKKKKKTKRVAFKKSISLTNIFRNWSANW